MNTAEAIADYIVEHNREAGHSAWDSTTQTELYLIQQAFLQKYNKPAFSDPIEAWGKGPIVPQVQEKFDKEYPYHVNHVPLEDTDTHLIDAIVHLVQETGYEELIREQILCKRSAWAKTYKNGKNEHAIIPLDMLRQDTFVPTEDNLRKLTHKKEISSVVKALALAAVIAVPLYVSVIDAAYADTGSWNGITFHNSTWDAAVQVKAETKSGVTYYVQKDLQDIPEVTSIEGKDFGLQEGDFILAADDVKTQDADDVEDELRINDFLNHSTTLTIARADEDGQLVMQTVEINTEETNDND